MRRPLFIAAACVLVGLTASAAFAVGTPAGTVIVTDATVFYLFYGSNQTMKSNVSTFMVDDKVSFTLTAADNANVTIAPGGRAYMTYLLTNTGNGPHDFTLHAAVTGTPTLTPSAGPTFYADSAGTIPLTTDPNAGNLPYIGSLMPDANRTVHMYISAPPQATDGQIIDYLITTEAYQPANLGVVNPPVKSSLKAGADTFANKNTNPIIGYVVLADSHGNGGDVDRDGKYTVIAKDGNGNLVGFKAVSAAVNVVKSASVTDLSGGSLPVSAARIRYMLSVMAVGAGTAMGVVITDLIPVNTTYLAGTLKLNGTGLTDIVDGDVGDVGSTTAGTVTVQLGNLTSASPVQTIMFDVKID